MSAVSAIGGGRPRTARSACRGGMAKRLRSSFRASERRPVNHRNRSGRSVCRPALALVGGVRYSKIRTADAARQKKRAEARFQRPHGGRPAGFRAGGSARGRWEVIDVQARYGKPDACGVRLARSARRAALRPRAASGRRASCSQDSSRHAAAGPGRRAAARGRRTAPAGAAQRHGLDSDEQGAEAGGAEDQADRIASAIGWTSGARRPRRRGRRCAADAPATSLERVDDQSDAPGNGFTRSSSWSPRSPMRPPMSGGFGGGWAISIIAPRRRLRDAARRSSADFGGGLLGGLLDLLAAFSTASVCACRRAGRRADAVESTASFAQRRRADRRRSCGPG